MTEDRLEALERELAHVREALISVAAAQNALRWALREAATVGAVGMRERGNGGTSDDE